MEPAKKAFTMGLIPAAISRPDIVGLRITRFSHSNSQEVHRRESRKETIYDVSV